MSWEKPLDKLLIDRIHRAEAGQVSDQEIEDLIRDLLDCASARATSWFHSGYGRTLLGLDLPVPGPAQAPAAHRWFAFGRLKGHMRRADAGWVAELAADHELLSDLLTEPAIAAQVLPGLMRSCFADGRFEHAVRLLMLMEHAAAERRRRDLEGTPELGILVEAGLLDLISRAEGTAVPPEAEGDLRRALLAAMELEHFDALSASDRARAFKTLAESHLATGEFEATARWLERARALAPEGTRTAARIAFLEALVHLRVLDLTQVKPEPARPAREAALAALERACGARLLLPEAAYVRGVLRYEVGEYEAAARDFLAGLALLEEERRDATPLAHRLRYMAGSALFAAGRREEFRRAAYLLRRSLPEVVPDIETFFLVHDRLKEVDPKLALDYLDRLDLGRGTSAENLLLAGLEYLSLGEPARAHEAAARVLAIATDLDHRLEALKIRLTAHNMQGRADAAREDYDALRELLLRRGALKEFEALLLDEELVGQALDHLEIKSELVDLYEEMPGREWDAAQLKLQIARSLKARKDVAELQRAKTLLDEIGLAFPDLAKEDLAAVEGLLRIQSGGEAAESPFRRAAAALGRPPRILVAGGNERQRRHVSKLEDLAAREGFEAEWIPANYRSPQRTVARIRELVEQGRVDALVLLHWNRHETTEPALALARKAGIPARTLFYAGFTSLAVCLAEIGERLGTGDPATAAD